MRTGRPTFSQSHLFAAGFGPWLRAGLFASAAIPICLTVAGSTESVWLLLTVSMAFAAIYAELFEASTAPRCQWMAKGIILTVFSPAKILIAATVGTAGLFVIPYVQEAREMAPRTQCKSNLFVGCCGMPSGDTAYVNCNLDLVSVWSN